VSEGSPIDQAGGLAGDVILALDGKPVLSVDDLHRSLGEESVGRTMPMTVLRNNATETLRVTPVDAGTVKD
jgi:S1-C subfamily serine protease